ncbi:39S ribosomal protein L51, mitochondrial [Apophysomyces sp. BC1034]|nr:39S ribosomal protein L51, mitochondrial [Apophysomyces sp. BC1015]KAG0180159.1 39S ribosomal protein L51, mitochondrial [Apophysomyces sp. BC1021]KAG0192771.1 39S ribosomal protein L51, mitochondrial [Apophysomyces sp. BC1034]
MSTAAASKLIPRTNNGTGAFVLQCRQLVFHYCEHWGSNKGMIDYIKKDLVKFAQENPQIEIVVQPRPARHPVVRGLYLNGRDKVICTRNLTPSQISKKVELLRDSSGEKMKLLAKKPVISTTESVRGIWSPFHTNPHTI